MPHRPVDGRLLSAAAADSYPWQRGRAAELLRRAMSDEKLASILMELPRDERQAVVAQEGVFHRETLARLFALRAEATLEAPGAETEEAAELAVAVAAALPSTQEAGAASLLGFGAWLLGKAQLRAGRVAEAAQTFRRSLQPLPNREPSEVRALACAGLAQLRWQESEIDDAAAFFGYAARLFSQAGDRLQQWVACHALCGLALLGNADVMLAKGSLEVAENLIDPELSPSLAILVLLGLARCNALVGKPVPTDRHRERARLLVLKRIGSDPPKGIEELTLALGDAVPGDGTAWAREIEALARLAGSKAKPEALQEAAARSLSQAGEQPQARAAAGLPLSLVKLADRVFLHRGEDEEPLGIARDA